MESSAGLLAGLLAGTAAALLLARPAPRPSPAGVGARDDGRPALLVAAACAGALLVTGHPRVAATALVLALAAAVLVRLAARRAADRRAAQVRTRVVELCDALSAELAAGATPAAALGRASGEWSALAPTARAAEVGGDVVGELRRLGDVPGARALHVVAAAWQVAARTGHGLADVLGRVADDLRAADRTRRIVVGELASAQATARLLAVLPALALAMGAGAGSRPWEFLVAGPAGLACLAGGLLLTLAGLSWIDGLARGVEADVR